MSIYQCPNCGMTRSGNQAMGLAMPQCQCAWQFSPPVTAQRTWVGLTDEEIEEIWAQAITQDNGRGAHLSNQPFVHIARAIEAKLKEKNT